MHLKSPPLEPSLPEWDWTQASLVFLQPMLAPEGVVEESCLQAYLATPEVYLVTDEKESAPIVDVLRRCPAHYGYAFAKLFREQVLGKYSRGPDEASFLAMCKERPSVLQQWLREAYNDDNARVRLNALGMMHRAFPEVSLRDWPVDEGMLAEANRSWTKWTDAHNLADAESWYLLGKSLFLLQDPAQELGARLLQRSFLTFFFNDTSAAFSRMEEFDGHFSLNVLMAPILGHGSYALDVFEYIAKVEQDPAASTRAKKYANRLSSEVWDLADIDFEYLDSVGSVPATNAMVYLAVHGTNEQLKERLLKALTPTCDVTDIFVTLVLPAMLKESPSLALQQVEGLSGGLGKWQSLLLRETIHPDWECSEQMASTTSDALLKILEPDFLREVCDGLFKKIEFPQRHLLERMWMLWEARTDNQRGSMGASLWPVVSVFSYLHELACGAYEIHVENKTFQNGFQHVPLLRFLHQVWPEHDRVWRTMPELLRDKASTTIGVEWFNTVASTLLPNQAMRFEEHANVFELLGSASTKDYYTTLLTSSSASLGLPYLEMAYEK